MEYQRDPDSKSKQMEDTKEFYRLMDEHDAVTLAHELVEHSDVLDQTDLSQGQIKKKGIAKLLIQEYQNEVK